MKITIIIPVSRESYLDLLFARLEMLDCKSEDTNLLVAVDGDEKLFVKVRNFVEMSKFKERLCLQFKSKHKLRHFDLKGRRLRISDIHNFIKEHINSCDYILGLEDDTIPPLNTLKKLIKDYSMHPYAGFIQGVQIGRWGIPYIGAWKVDDIYEPTLITSLESKTVNNVVDNSLEEIDAGGLYCFITKKDNYVNHFFQPFSNNNLGPDVNFGLELRREGLLNYIDWSISTTHKTKNKDINVYNTETRVAVLKKIGTTWRQSNHS